MTVEKDWCDQVVDMDFEDTRLMAPAGWHEILTEVYGDYMTLAAQRTAGAHPLRPGDRGVWLRRKREGRAGCHTAEERIQDGLMDRKVSVVVSVYNEEKALEEFYRETGKGLKGAGLGL